MFAEINKEAYDSLPVVLNTVGTSPRQGPINHVNGFNYHEFIWVENGCGDFVLNGSSYTLEKGYGVFIRKNTPHAYNISVGSEVFSTAWFTFTLDESVLDRLGIKDYLLFKVPPFLEDERASLDRFSVGESSALLRSAGTYSLVAELFSVLLPKTETLESKVRTYLENHYSEPLTLDKIAEAVGSTRFALCHYYSRNVGKRVIDELTDIRIAKAKRFLKYTTDQIGQIGRMCGFESAGYFSMRFRERCGMTPLEYRNTRTRG